MPSNAKDPTSKPWYKSLTIVPTMVATLAMWAASMGFITQEEQTAGLTLLESIVTTITHLGVFIGVVGLRRAVSPIHGLGSGASVIAGVGLVALIAAGCASFDRVGVVLQATAHKGAEVISQLECEGFRMASAGMVLGPNQTVYLLGRAGELKALAEDLERQGVVCDEVIRRNTLSRDDLDRVRAAFDRMWIAAAEAVK